MAGFTSHYRFGVHSFHKMNPGVLRNIIKKHPSSFSIGLQGPDPFFFEPVSYIRRKGNPGGIAHSENGGHFALSLIRNASSMTDPCDREIAISYASGYLGHYELDAAVHPYVYGKVDPDSSGSLRTLGKHFLLENDIDSAILKHETGKKLSEFRMHSVVRLSFREKYVITRLLKSAYSEVYPETEAGSLLIFRALFCEWLAMLLLEDSTGLKKSFVNFAENVILGFPFAAGIVGSNDPHPSMQDPLNLTHQKWINTYAPGRSHTESVPDLFRRAHAHYLTDLSVLDKYITCSSDKSGKIYKRISAVIGNGSMHSGK